MGLKVSHNHNHLCVNITLLIIINLIRANTRILITIIFRDIRDIINIVILKIMRILNCWLAFSLESMCV